MDLLDFGLYMFYVLLIISVGAALIFPLVKGGQDPKALGRSAMAVGGLVLLFVISYLMSGSDVNVKGAAVGLTETGSKLIGAGLIMFYITLVLSILALIYSEISKALK
jgi:hypothetical protein